MSKDDTVFLHAAQEKVMSDIFYHSIFRQTQQRISRSGAAVHGMVYNRPGHDLYDVGNLSF